jgi:hypothetical protein
MQSKQPVGSAGQGNKPDSACFVASVLRPTIGSINLHKSKRCDTITHNAHDLQSKQPVGSAGQGNEPDSACFVASVLRPTIGSINLHKRKRSHTITHNVQDMQSKQPVGSAGQGINPDSACCEDLFCARPSAPSTCIKGNAITLLLTTRKTCKASILWAVLARGTNLNLLAVKLCFVPNHRLHQPA